MNKAVVGRPLASALELGAPCSRLRFAEVQGTPCHGFHSRLDGKRWPVSLPSQLPNAKSIKQPYLQHVQQTAFSGGIRHKFKSPNVQNTQKAEGMARPSSCGPISCGTCVAPPVSLDHSLIHHAFHSCMLSAGARCALESQLHWTIWHPGDNKLKARRCSGNELELPKNGDQSPGFFQLQVLQQRG